MDQRGPMEIPKLPRLLLGVWGKIGPCVPREALREPRMLITQGSLLNGGEANQFPAFHPESLEWRLLMTW